MAKQEETTQVVTEAPVKTELLTADQLEQLKTGMEVKETIMTPGWKHIQEMLDGRAFHSWVDPRETKSKEEWDWRELNAFHSHDVALEIIEDINDIVRTALELEDIRLGKSKPKPMKI